MERTYTRWRTPFGILAATLILTFAGCQGSGGSASGSNNGGITGGEPPGPLPIPSVMPQGYIALDPQSDLQAPLKLRQKTGSITVTASEEGYSGSFSASVVDGTCIAVEPPRASEPTTAFDVHALDAPCAISSIEVTDQNGHHASDYFSVH